MLNRNDKSKYYPTTQNQIDLLRSVEVNPCPECKGIMTRLKADDGRKNEDYCSSCHLSVPHYIA